MFALEIKNNPTPVSNTSELIQYPVTISIYNPLRTAKRNITFGRDKKLRTRFTSVGMGIPFQPSMWDDKTIDAIWANAMKNLEQKMKGVYADEIIVALLDRLTKLFTKLNFNTHRKSLAIILTPDGEKDIYLNFPVKPVIFFAKNISTLELAANIQQETSFFCLVLDEKKSEMYDFNGTQLRKVYEERGKANFISLSKHATKAVEILNGENGKPVFVTGNPNLVELFCNSNVEAGSYNPLFYNVSPFSKKMIESVVHEIATHWDYWRAKSIKNRILFAQKTNRIISNVESVLQALNKGMDGILLLDKRLKKQLQKPDFGNMISGFAAELNTQIEKFLIKGNQIEIAETGLLRGFGGIVLLPTLKKSVAIKFHHKTMPGELF